MEFDPKIPPVLTSERQTFAYVSALERWPVILTSAIDDLHRSWIQLPDEEEEKQKEGKEIISQLAALKYELLHDRKLTPLPDDGEEDIEVYNKELEEGGEMSWFNAPWLYAECYLYRRINVIFSRTKRWKHYDIFARQKMATFKSSRPAVLELGARYTDLHKEIKAHHSGEQDEKAEELLFVEMCEICLWGNATDLSLLTSLTYDDIQKLQGSKARKAAEENILVNDLPAAFAVLNDARKIKKNQERRVDIVLDNAGFELFVDLILAGYLLLSGLATTVVLHPKSIPWFVSDVLPKDFADLVSALADPQAFFTAADDEHDPRSNGEPAPPLSENEVSELQSLFNQWAQLHADGKLIIRPNRFWTTAGSYWRIPNAVPDLWNDLKQSELVLFKGDLNYRKLTGDAHWDPTTPFSDAIGPLGRNSGIRTLALRTCKADVVVGLPEGEDERIRETPGGGGDSGARKWAWSGKWAVVQFCDGKA
ncbi:Hairy/enhancer-of-split with YRPW motif protein 2 [Emydomyces testavorans]|uniref:Sugar phosphate phosphatase n=1 Tax=Emydomyces testavorans TaxID=2070801 RepID=A0AAF0DFB9_9EURO|nr:Hairy/enhancer-of-split with YRPW motif protein 2 [Emydomyces testavorans]